MFKTLRAASALDRPKSASALDRPKSSAGLPNSYWSLCKVLSLERECYSRFIVRNSTQRYSRFITKNSMQRYCSAEVVCFSGAQI